MMDFKDNKMEERVVLVVIHDGGVMDVVTGSSQYRRNGEHVYKKAGVMRGNPALVMTRLEATALAFAFSKNENPQAKDNEYIVLYREGNDDRTAQSNGKFKIDWNVWLECVEAAKRYIEAHKDDEDALCDIQVQEYVVRG